MKILELIIKNPQGKPIEDIKFNEVGVSFIYADIQNPANLKGTINSLGKTLLLKFIDYIFGANEDLAMVVPPPEYKARGAALNRGNLYAEIIRQEVLFPKVVLAQALLETGYFSSRVCWELNNLFGLRKRNGEYMRFEKWEDSVVAYRDYVQYKYKGGNYFDFLNRIGYAEDRTYTSKVRQIFQTID